MSKALKKYKKELKSFFNNASKEKSQYTTIYVDLLMSILV